MRIQRTPSFKRYDDVLATLQARHDHVANLSTATDWEERRREVLQAFRGADGLFSPLPPVKRATPRVRSSNDRPPATGDGFEVRRLVIETRPNYWVPASLWVPSVVNAPSTRSLVPAILYSAGHEGPAWRWDGADDWLAGGGDQVVLLNLVQRGFVVLAFDPIGQGERQMYQDVVDPDTPNATKVKQMLNGSQQYGGSQEHEYVHRQLVLLGTNAASAWVWDMTRLMDYLESLPFVNPSKLAAAGCSGGGTQTAYFSAIDDRVSSASIACYTSTFIVDYAPNSPDSVVNDEGVESSWPLGGGGPADGEQT